MTYCVENYVTHTTVTGKGQRGRAEKIKVHVHVKEIKK